MRLIDADKIIFREIDEIGGEYEPYLGCSKSQIDSLPSVTPQLSSELDKNSKKLEKGTTKNNLGVEEVTALAEWTTRLTKASEDAYHKGYADGMNDQELILDKIRAEIEQARYGLVNDGLDIALNIIDKYKAETR